MNLVVIRALAIAVLLGSPVSATLDAPPEPTEVALLAGEFHLSREAAARQLGRQDALDAVHADAQRRWPRTFAGAWVDHAAGGVLSLAFTRDAAANVAALAGDTGLRPLLRPVALRHSYAALQALQRRIVADRELARVGRWRLPDVLGHRYEIDIDVRRNTVVVTAPTATDRTAAAIHARYGDDIVVKRRSTAGPDECSISDCRYSLQSGLKITKTTGAYCSAAFSANNHARLFTAGHCGLATWKQGTDVYGTTEQIVQWGRVDAALHTTLGGTGEFYFGAWTHSGNEPAGAIVSTGTWSALTVGDWLCKVGARTGFTCGVVLSKDLSPSYIALGERFVSSSMCTNIGDSGAGVFINGKAVGIHSGHYSTCSDPAFYAIHGHIEYAQAEFGATVDTSEPAPTFSSIGSARQGTSSVGLTFNKPVVCGSMSPGDFVVRTKSLTGTTLTTHTVTGFGCWGDSYTRPTLAFSPGATGLTTLEVSIVNLITDRGGNPVTHSTRSTAVSL